MKDNGKTDTKKKPLDLKHMRTKANLCAGAPPPMPVLQAIATGKTMGDGGRKCNQFEPRLSSLPA
jgi:hypothetical protein